MIQHGAERRRSRQRIKEDNAVVSNLLVDDDGFET